MSQVQSEVLETPVSPAVIPQAVQANKSTGLALASRPTMGMMPAISEERSKEKLTPTARKEFQGAINRRAKNMLNALGGSMSGNIDIVIKNLRDKSGIVHTEDQLKVMIKKCDEEIREEVGKYLGPEKLRIESATESSNEEFDRLSREMKARHKAEWEDLKKKRIEAANVLRAELVNAEQKVRAEHTKHLSGKREEYTHKLTEVREIEARITTEAEHQIRLIESRKSTITSLLEDCTGRASERLLTIGTVGEAQQLVEMIPTVQEALAMSKSAYGLGVMMHKLDPDTFPMPQEEEISVEPSQTRPDVVVDAVVDVDSADDEDTETASAMIAERDRLAQEEEIEQLDDQHDEIYQDSTNRRV